jgi:hypothetical protein
MRALPVVGIDPVSRVLSGTDPATVQLSRANCFVSGEPACSLLVDTSTDTLYTLTAPSLSGSDWHWFSHVWIRPAPTDR